MVGFGRGGVQPVSNRVKQYIKERNFITLIYLGKAFGLGIEYTPTHADDLVFITTGLIEPELLSEEEKLVSQHMNRYWTTFAKFGKPSHIDKSSPVWYPYDIKEKVDF